MHENSGVNATAWESLEKLGEREVTIRTYVIRYSLQHPRTLLIYFTTVLAQI